MAELSVLVSALACRMFSVYLSVISSYAYIYCAVGGHYYIHYILYTRILCTYYILYIVLLCIILYIII